MTGEEGDICKVCDRKFIIHEHLKDKNLQIEAQTRQLLGKGGLKDQIDILKEKLLRGRGEIRRQKQIYGLDYQKVQLTINKMTSIQEKASKQNQKLQEQCDEIYQRQSDLAYKKTEVSTELD
jgi:uncharacterized protein YllA (UPF0747 family)